VTNFALFADFQAIDARCKLVMPAVIDSHTHFEIPLCGAISFDDFDTRACTCASSLIPAGSASIQFLPTPSRPAPSMAQTVLSSTRQDDLQPDQST
jgi:hypothetical protein